MTYVFRISGEMIDGQPLCCLGSQLARVVSLLAASLGEVVWYSTDVDVTGSGFPMPSQNVHQLGPSSRLVELAQGVDQFLRGVFLAVDTNMRDPHFRDNIDTEDSDDAELGDAVLEIRTFDTTYFEVYTRDDRLAEFVARIFGVQPGGRKVAAKPLTRA